MLISRVYRNNNFYTKIKLPSLLYNKYLIKWQPNSSSIIHGHDYTGKFMLIHGKMHEIIYDENELKKSQKNLNLYEENNVDKIMKHKMININDKLSFTYHIDDK